MTKTATVEFPGLSAKYADGTQIAVVRGMTNELLTRITEHLQSEGKPVVIIATYLKATEYKPKHLSMFSANEREAGVYVQAGRRKDYVMPQYVRFGCYVAAKEQA